MSPLGVLARGYAIVRADSGVAAGKAIRDAAEVVPGQKLAIRVHKGSFTARVEAALADAPVQDSPLEEHS
jgi:exonuclease VII large subunit